MAFCKPCNFIDGILHGSQASQKEIHRPCRADFANPTYRMTTGISKGHLPFLSHVVMKTRMLAKCSGKWFCRDHMLCVFSGRPLPLDGPCPCTLSRVVPYLRACPHRRFPCQVSVVCSCLSPSHNGGVLDSQGCTSLPGHPQHLAWAWCTAGTQKYLLSKLMRDNCATYFNFWMV